MQDIFQLLLHAMTILKEMEELTNKNIMIRENIVKNKPN